MNSHSSPLLYKAQDLSEFFNLTTCMLGIFSHTQRDIGQEDIEEHKRSAFLVGANLSEQAANHQSRQGYGYYNGILFINSSLIKDHLFDVGMSMVTSNFFLSIKPAEKCMTFLPVCAVQSIKFTDNNKRTVPNPFYVAPVSEDIVQEYQSIYQAHKNCLQALINHGETMTADERQDELDQLIISYDKFYQKHLGNNNPLAMTLTQFKEKFGGNYLNIKGITLSNTETIKELLMNTGDAIFMKSMGKNHHQPRDLRHS